MATSLQTTVVMPVRNGERFVREAVDSVLSQLADHDELLLVDDASTDRTRALLDESDPRLRLLEGPGRGPSAARNLGLGQARGEFIAFLDHDDLWPPGRHTALLSALLAEPAANAAVGRIRVRVEADAPAAHYSLGMEGRQLPNVLPSCLYRRALVERAGRFDEGMRFSEDFDFHRRLLEAGMKTTYCEADSLVYRRHGGNATNAAPATGLQLLEVVSRKLERERGSPERQG